MPLEALGDEASAGPPRCYFCGKQIAREEDVRKTRFEVGHGQAIFVMICPSCRSMKERGEGPFQSGPGPEVVVGCFIAVVLVVVVLLAVLRPWQAEPDLTPKKRAGVGAAADTRPGTPGASTGKSPMPRNPGPASRTADVTSVRAEAIWRAPAPTSSG